MKPGAHQDLREKTETSSFSLLFYLPEAFFFFNLKIDFFCFSMNENVASHRSRAYILQIQPPKDTDLFHFQLQIPGESGYAWITCPPMPYIVSNDQGQDKGNGCSVNTALLQ